MFVDSPRSDVEESTNTDIKGIKQNRPSTAPPKRLLSTSTPSGGRPRSARFDSSTSVNYIDESENKENLNGINNNLVENLIYLQSGLFITGINCLRLATNSKQEIQCKPVPVLIIVYSLLITSSNDQPSRKMQKHPLYIHND